MKNLHHQKKQRGISLLESLVAILVVALGILGILGVQMRTLIDTNTSVHRSQAIRYIEDMSERLRVNPNALQVLNSYISTYAQTAIEYTGADCSTKSCNSTQQASLDLLEWKTALENNLPSGQASIFLAPGETIANNRRLLGIMVAWRENEHPGSKQSATDASQHRNEDGTFSTGTNIANECPEGFTCHLQYISVAARCAPYGGGIPYCS